MILLWYCFSSGVT